MIIRRAGARRTLAPGAAQPASRAPPAWAGEEVFCGCADRGRTGPDGGGIGAGGPAAVVAGPGGPGRAAGAGTARGSAVPPGPGRGNRGHRGARAAQAAQVDGARDRARVHVLGLPGADADHHRGLRHLFDKKFPGIDHWAFIAFIEDLFAVLVLVGIITFAIIRLRNNPHREGRDFGFAGSHTGAAWLVLLGIFLVVATLLIYRGAQINTGDFPTMARSRPSSSGTGWPRSAPAAACWRRCSSWPSWRSSWASWCS